MDELQPLTDPASAAAAAESLPTMTYDVVRHRGSWRVFHLGKHSAPHPSQRAAIDSAIKAAAQDLANGRIIAVRLNRTDGRIFDLTSDVERT